MARAKEGQGERKTDPPEEALSGFTRFQAPKRRQVNNRRTLRPKGLMNEPQTAIEAVKWDTTMLGQEEDKSDRKEK